MSGDNIEMRIITQADAERVIEFLLKTFYPDVPLRSPQQQPKTKLSAEEVDSIHQCIDSGCSIMAVETTKDATSTPQIAGVTLALPNQRSIVDEYFQLGDSAGHSNRGHLMRLLGIVNRDAKAFDRYGVDEVLYLSIISVSPESRGKNVAIRMTQELMKVGRSLNYKALTVDCASLYCARVCERLGMECLASLDYKDYLDSEGKIIFDVAPPHMAMKTYGVRL